MNYPVRIFFLRTFLCHSCQCSIYFYFAIDLEEEFVKKKLLATFLQVLLWSKLLSRIKLQVSYIAVKEKYRKESGLAEYAFRIVIP